MKFGEFNPADHKLTVWGTATVVFHDCNNLTLEYSSNDPAFGSGIIPMQRLTSVAGLKCSDSPLHGSYSAIITEQGDFSFGVATLFENGNMVYYAGDESMGVVVSRSINRVHRF